MFIIYRFISHVTLFIDQVNNSKETCEFKMVEAK